MAKKTKIAIWILMAVMIAALLSPRINALGITPGRTVLNFEDNKEEKIRFTILNNENKDMKVMIYFNDQDKKFIGTKPAIIDFKAGEPSKDFEFSLVMAGAYLNPGMNEIKIRALELPPGFEGDENAKITATVELIHQIRINVPYPGKYAESDVYITSNDEEKSLLFTIPIFNKGKEDIGKAKAAIEIFDAEGKSVIVIETNEISLGSGKEGKVTAELNSKLGRGRYKAKVKLDYDGKSIEMEKEFFVSVPLIRINSVLLDNGFSLGGIAKFALLLESMWNQRIDDVHSDIRITDQNNREMTRFKTASESIDANSIAKLDAYWDTKDISPGLYRMDVILNYLNLVNEKVFDMDVGFDTINIREYGATGAVVANKGKGLSKNLVLGSAVFILVVLNIALILYFRRKMRPKETVSPAYHPYQFSDKDNICNGQSIDDHKNSP